MKITITQIQATLISSVLLAGLAACSSEPAPWTRPDQSPWSEKHAAAKSSEEVVVVEEPVIINEPQPMAEPVMIEEPVAVAAVAVPEPVPQTPEEQIMAMSSGYAVQIYATTRPDSLDKFIANNGLDDMLAVKTDRNGSLMYVLVSPENDRHAADMRASVLEQQTGSKPWVRSIQSLQNVIIQ